MDIRVFVNHPDHGRERVVLEALEIFLVVLLDDTKARFPVSVAPREQSIRHIRVDEIHDVVHDVVCLALFLLCREVLRFLVSQRDVFDAVVNLVNLSHEDVEEAFPRSIVDVVANPDHPVLDRSKERFQTGDALDAIDNDLFKRLSAALCLVLHKEVLALDSAKWRVHIANVSWHWVRCSCWAHFWSDAELSANLANALVIAEVVLVEAVIIVDDELPHVVADHGEDFRGKPAKVVVANVLREQ